MDVGIRLCTHRETEVENAHSATIRAHYAKWFLSIAASRPRFELVARLSTFATIGAHILGIFFLEFRHVRIGIHESGKIRTVGWAVSPRKKRLKYANQARTQEALHIWTGKITWQFIIQASQAPRLSTEWNFPAIARNSWKLYLLVMNILWSLKLSRHNCCYSS